MRSIKTEGAAREASGRGPIRLLRSRPLPSRDFVAIHLPHFVGQDSEQEVIVMSMSLVWFAAHGIEPEVFLERAGFTDTGDPDEYFDEEHSGGALAGGWYVIVSNDVGLLDPAKVAGWSAGGRVVAVALDEESLNSMAIEWADGKLVWSAAYDGSEGGDQLAVEGTLPAVFQELQHEASALQAEGGSVEHVFDIPLDLAADVTGFRHDELGFDDDIGPFTALERVHIA